MSGYREEIDQKLRDKIAYTKIAAWLAKRDVIISTSSIARHKKNHLINEENPEVIQKEAIRKAKAKAEKDKSMSKGLPINSPNEILTAEQYGYIQELEKLKKDFDAINEMVETLAIAKNRMLRAINEENDNGLVLATTGRAIKDYAELVQDFKDMMSGSDSIAKMRFTQLINMITEIFGSTDISDITRHELYGLLGGFEDDAEVPSIRPSTDISTQTS